MDFIKGQSVLVIANQGNTTWIGARIKTVLKKGWRVETKYHKEILFIPSEDNHRIRAHKKTGSENPKNKSTWPSGHEEYLRNNYKQKTNQELANALGVGLTVLRNKLQKLGLKRYEMEFWTSEQVAFLVANYTKMGDVAIAEHFKKHYPKNKGWSKSQVNKKRQQFGLHRSPEEVEKIKEANKEIVSKKVSAFMLDIWKKVKRKEQLGMSIAFTKHRSRRKQTHTPVFTQKPSSHIEF